MRITTRGQVTIPADLRKRAGLLPKTEVEFEFDGNGVRIRRASTGVVRGRGAAAVGLLRGQADAGMSTDEILALTRP